MQIGYSEFYLRVNEKGNKIAGIIRMEHEAFI